MQFSAGRPRYQRGGVFAVPVLWSGRKCARGRAATSLRKRQMPKLPMSKKTLNKTNLEALGAGPLADLLMEISEGSADIKRRLRLELSHSLGAAELAHDVRKRLVSLNKSTTSVSWRKRKALVKDLDTQLAMIVEKIAPEDATTAFDLLWQFVELAPSIYMRVDDSRGEVADVFRAATEQFAQIAPRADLAPQALADRVWAALLGNRYGEWDGIIPLAAPALKAEGLAALKTHAQAYGAATLKTPAKASPDEHAAIRFLRELRGEMGDVADGVASGPKARFVKACLQEIATAAGDTQAYIAQYSHAELVRKGIAAEIAERLLTDGAAQDALDHLLAADRGAQDTERDAQDDAWDAAYIASLTALGRVEAAQAHRWACFTATLNATHLRDHLKLLPDFDDVEAEDRAKAYVLAYPDTSAALQFCLDWPDLLTAAQLIYARVEDIRGDHEALLTQTAEALRARHPLAAVLLWRLMVDDTLDYGRAPRYPAAAEHLVECAALDAEITDYGRFLPHERYLTALRAEHDRKSSFWAVVG